MENHELRSAVGCNEIAPLLLFFLACQKAALQTVQCAALIAPYLFRQFVGVGGERHTSPKQQKGRSAPRLFMSPLYIAVRSFGVT